MVFKNYREVVTIETEAETNTIAIEEDPQVDTDVDLPMIIVEEATTIGAAMITGLTGEDPVAARLPILIRTTMAPQALEVAIRTAHLVEGVALHRTFVEVVVTVAAGMRIFQVFPCWFATSDPTSPITTSKRHLDALVMFAMFTFQGITIRNKLRALHLLSMQIPTVSIRIA